MSTEIKEKPVEGIDWSVRLGIFGGSDMAQMLQSSIEREKVYKRRPDKQGYTYQESEKEGKIVYLVDMRKYYELGETQKTLILSKEVESLYKRSSRRSQFPTIEMKHGKFFESEAIKRIRHDHSMKFEKIGTRTNEKYPLLCGTPDGVILEDGKVVDGVEIKCPFNEVNHLKSVQEGKINYEYQVQMHVYMMIFELDHWRYFSFDPNAPQSIRGHLVKVKRNPEIIEDIEFILEKIKEYQKNRKEKYQSPEQGTEE